MANELGIDPLLQKLVDEPLFQSLLKAPQTQKDIRTIAATAEELQSPEIKKQISELKDELTALSATVLILQGISAMAVVGMFAIQLMEYRDRQRKQGRRKK